MFFSRNVLAVSKYTKSLCNNVTRINKHNLSNLLQKGPKQPTRDYSSDNVQITTATAYGTEREAEDLHTFNYDAITKGSKELEHKLKVLMLEAEVLRQEGHPIPSNDYIKPDMWEILLNSPTRSQRKKYLEYLFKNSKKKENRLIKKLEKQKLTEDHRAVNPLEGQKDIPVEELASQYRLNRNSIFLRFHDTTINRLYNNRLIQAMQFGQKIVIDCGYDKNMSRRENYNCAKQLMLCFADNRNSDQPFDIHFANINKESDIMKMLNKYIPTLYDPEFPMNIHDKSYLELFPRENLVYLTPHCREEMEAYDPDAVYIIGAIVDKINNEPLSLAKAKREGIKMKKFPLDKYLQWGAGSGKSLTLNQCVSILLDVKETNDWHHALRHVPRRKLVHQSTNDSFDRNDRFSFNRETTWKDRNTDKNFSRGRDENRFNSNGERSWKDQSTDKNFSRGRDENRFNSNGERSWKDQSTDKNFSRGRDENRFNSNGERSWKDQSTDKNFSRGRDENRFNSNGERSWKDRNTENETFNRRDGNRFSSNRERREPRYNKKPTYMKDN